MRVDTMPASDVKIDLVSDALRGVPGTKVNVVFARAGVAEPVKLSFKRAVVHVPAVPYATMVGDQIGYIPLQTFNENTAEEVEAAASCSTCATTGAASSIRRWLSARSS